MLSDTTKDLWKGELPRPPSLFPLQNKKQGGGNNATLTYLSLSSSSVSKGMKRKIQNKVT